MISDAQLFIRTHRRDLDWLRVNLASTVKYWTSGFSPLIIATPDCEPHMPAEASLLGAKVIYELEWPDKRRATEWIAQQADKYVDSSVEAILFHDSDSLFVMPCNASDFCNRTSGAPTIIYSEYLELLEGSTNPWDHEAYIGYRKYVTAGLGRCPPAEYMRQQPFLFYLDTIRACREEVEKRSGKTFKAFMEGFLSRHSSEFNLFGAYAWFFERERYDFVSTTEAPVSRVRTFHSWTQTPQTCAEEIAKFL